MVRERGAGATLAIVKTSARLAATAACVALIASPALAGEYVVTTCSPSGSPGPWVSSTTAAAALAIGDRCGGPAIGAADGSHDGALYAQDIRSVPVDIADRSRAGWTFTAPAGTTITAISYYRRLAAGGDPGLVAGLYRGDGVTLEECKGSRPLQPAVTGMCSMPNRQVPVTFSDLHTSALFVGVGCRPVRPATACGAGGSTLPAVQADLYSAQVTLSESDAPALSDLGGALWRGGVVSGVVPVTFAASDLTGIKQQEVRDDSDTTLISVLRPCDFTIVQPCAQQPAGSLNVDTTRVADGSRTFSLAVTDAAGNTRVATSPPIMIDNAGPPPPAELTAAPGRADSDAIALSWRNPPDAPAPVMSAMVQLCQATCPPPTSLPASGSALLTASGPGLYSVRLWLVDAHGRGGPHNAALATIRLAAPNAATPTATETKTNPGTKPRTQIAAVLRGRRLRVSGTLAETDRAEVTWHSSSAGRTLGRGSRMVTIRDGTIAATFTLRPRPRTRAAIISVTVRSAGRIVAHARARRE